jgi:Common central domain of tyrosinase
MSVRKNAKFLNTIEREALVRAFVTMKADIVNPAAAPADQYSRWDQYVAIHRMIQNANMPGSTNVNFGHGGTGAYGFLPWHRYFLHLLEQQLQIYVPGVTIPYWDWTDPTGAVLVTDFLGPNGDSTSNYEVRQGYFAKEAPGTGINTTLAPGWWPAGLTGWNLHSTFGSWAGALKRRIGLASALPSAATLRSALDKATLPTFQNALESGSGTVPFHQLHNGLHGWFGANTHMSSTTPSPFDPIFYLHHCNVDRLWAMWQMDGHATEYPVAGGNPGHNRNDPMYPWVGALAGYASNLSFPPITMPDFSALGVVTAADVLDHRALGYSYDTQVVIGLALDRTGSMLALTPDPMVAAAPDVTKWEAAKRGVSAFLLDCETAYASGEAYVVSGVKTFRSLLANDFAPVFAGTPYGLIKPAGAYSRAAFDAAVAVQTPGGGTPLADALLDTHATLVAPPFGWIPPDERRYLALFTDGLLTSGAPLASIPDGSLAQTAVFALGFGTGADVDYATLAALVAKGQPLTTGQVFHGDNAGVIDKFYSQALAAAIGFTPVLDPVLELFEGEHTHFEITATSAEEAFFLTAQGMDFQDDGWSYQLIAPDGEVAYAVGDLPLHEHGGGHGGHGCGCGRRPRVTARQGAGRLSLFVQRDSADAAAWVGSWMLMIAWRARTLDGMMMIDPSELLVPVAAGPLRGPRYARLLVDPRKRIAARAVAGVSRHRLDVRATSTNRSQRDACTVVVNVYARTRLRLDLILEADAAGKRPVAGEAITLNLVTDALRGTTGPVTAFARLVAPTRDLAALVEPGRLSDSIKKEARLGRTEKAADGLMFDSARILARLEAKEPALAELRDEEVQVVVHHESLPHVHLKKTEVPGPYHVGLWIEGTYLPGESGTAGHDGTGHGGPEHGSAGGAQGGERFTRVLTASVGLARPK